MREFGHQHFFSSDLTDKKFIDIHLSVKVAIEWFLAQEFYKGDMTRIMYSEPEIAFRKRIEYNDKKDSYDEDAEIAPESLNLPFSSYYASSDPEPDDRPSSVSAAQSIIGEWDNEYEMNIRSLAVKQTYKITMFVARRDEARLVQQLYLWESQPKYPLRIYHTIELRNNNLSVPINLTIENINTNPDYKERDWLTKNRIFPIEVEVTVRTYQLLINSLDNFCQLPLRFSNVIDTYDELNPPTEYITEKVILNWASEKFDLNMDEEDVDYESDDIQAILKSPYYFDQKQLSEAEKLQSCAAIPTNYTTDTISAYFQEDYSVELNFVRYNKDKSKPTEAFFEFMVKPACFKYFDRLVFSIPAKEDVVVTDCKARTVTYPGLVQNSEYKVTVMAYGTDGSIKTYFLTIVTPEDGNDASPTPEKINKRNGLVGMRLF
jgi:hypothetical protein